MVFHLMMADHCTGLVGMSSSFFPQITTTKYGLFNGIVLRRQSKKRKSLMLYGQGVLGTLSTVAISHGIR